jgi:hypothetical protein
VADVVTPDAKFTMLVGRFGRDPITASVVDAEDHNVNCPGLEARMNYTDNTVGVSIPRSCLGSPQWVQVGLGMITSRPHAVGYTDDALTSAPAGNAKHSPRIRRG